MADTLPTTPSDASDHGPRYRIGEVAELVGTTARTIRYYEERGLLGVAGERPKGAHRLYSDSDVDRLREIVRLRDLLGLPLEELVTVIEAEQARDCLRRRYHSAGDDTERARILRHSMPLVKRQLGLVRARRETLAEFERELAEKLELIRERLDELGD
jgi:DNA-binding transcriptional MerR regulator